MEKVKQLLQEALQMLENEAQQAEDCASATPRVGDKDAFQAWLSTARKALDRAARRLFEAARSAFKAFRTLGQLPERFLIGGAQWTDFGEKALSRYALDIPLLEGHIFRVYVNGLDSTPDLWIKKPEGRVAYRIFDTGLVQYWLRDPRPSRIYEVLTALDRATHTLEEMENAAWAYGRCLVKDREADYVAEVEAMAEEEKTEGDE